MATRSTCAGGWPTATPRRANRWYAWTRTDVLPWQSTWAAPPPRTTSRPTAECASAAAKPREERRSQRRNAPAAAERETPEGTYFAAWALQPLADARPLRVRGQR